MRILLFVLFVVWTGSVVAHETPPVIVDTDMALDDARALALLLNSPELDIRAIVTSDGGCAPRTGATNVCRLLNFLNRTNIVVGVGRSLGLPAPPWRAHSETNNWLELAAPAPLVNSLTDAVSVLREALTAGPAPAWYVCLGPLTNLADALRAEPQLAERIAIVFWHGTAPDAAQPGWNAARDLPALKAVVAAGVRIEYCQLPDEKTPVLDDVLLNEIAAVDSPAARLIVKLHQTGRARELIEARHLRLWDDLVALRVLRPSFTGREAAAVRSAYVESVRRCAPRATVVLAEFPDEVEHLLPDLREPARAIIARHGLEEWKATVLTCELHRHLGTYSILGAKMGLRARELLGAALDELHVESHAGLKPPLSCMNDGLQVATGASLGRGTITVTTPADPRCEATFVRGRQRLRLRLKEEIAAQVSAELAQLVKKHGGLTPAYFEAVRAQSLRHWLELDRTQIFEAGPEP